MGWVHRTNPETTHVCAPPTREVTYRLPASARPPGAEPAGHVETVPDGAVGDLWRCDWAEPEEPGKYDVRIELRIFSSNDRSCGKLWRIGVTCDWCDHYGAPHDADRSRGHETGLKWRPATWWQSVRNRRGRE